MDTVISSDSNSKKNTMKDGSISGKTFSGLGSLIKLLPTGTFFLFQFLSPVATDNGHCNTVNKYLTGTLLGVCGLSCFFSSFTDSYVGSDGETHYGVATMKGLWPAPASESLDMSGYKLRFGDFVHAFISLMVFAVLGLLDTNTVRCFYPEFEATEKILIQMLPAVFGSISSAVSVMFPNNRHGIGYPSSTDTTQKSK